ncbi:MAG: ABC-F family ATP-binding cassette domain-containing protein [Acidimicrobiales bacterium]
MILLDASRLAASRPDRPLFADVSLTVSDGDRVGVVGINGSGKTTLLRMFAREIDPQPNPDGTVGTVRRGRGVRFGVLSQQPVLPVGTVRDAVGHGWQGEAMLTRLGMGDMLDADTSGLSGGQAKRTALARLLATELDLLVLDEPTNHLDLDAIAFLEQWLAGFRGGLVMVTHDRHVLDRVTNKVLELDRGTAYVHVPAGWHAGSGYAAYLDGRAEREARAEVTEQARRNLAKRELAWLRRGAPARTSKPKARIAAATAVVEARPDAPARAGDLTLAMGSQRLGSKGVELRDVSFAWPGGPSVLEHVTVQLEPGDRIGIVGPNGAGKSTLLDLVAGRQVPDAGSVELGSTVRIGYYDQLGRELDLGQRVREAVAGDKGQPSLDDLTLMRRFWFDGDAQYAPIGLLSGGERRRLQLLLTLVEQPNVLLLDEPTNDLDLDTLRALEDLLDDWPGIAVVVSHDRAFLDRTVDEVWAVEGTGTVRAVRGGVAGWLAEREAAASAASVPGPTAPGTSSGAGRSAGSSVASPRTKPAAGRSPSTVRRQLGQVEREVHTATERRDAVAAELALATDHRELTRLSEVLADAQHVLDAAEERWLELAAEAEDLGLDLSS